MSLQSLPGGYAYLGPTPFSSPATGINTTTLSTAGNAVIFTGRIRTSDGGSHTIDTTGSSSLGWRCNAATWANVGSSISIGLADVDGTNGQPARAVNSSGTISFDVKSVQTGGSGVSGGAWNTSAPTTGSKTVANGDYVAFAIQMTAKGGSDSIQVSYNSILTAFGRPGVTNFVSPSTFSQVSNSSPILVITFSDGTLGWIEGAEVASVYGNRPFLSGSATKEYGQLYQMPFSMRVLGVYGYVGLNAAANFDAVLYSDPLGTPVAEKTASVLGQNWQTGSSVWFYEMFAAPYDVAVNQPIGVAYKPGASGSFQTYYKTLASAAHRAADAWGTSGYGISRASGAFANSNSGLDHYWIGLLVSAFDGGGGGSFGVIGS